MKLLTGFWKFIKGETLLQKDVCQYLNLQYPEVLFHHSPNEAKRTPFERFLIKIMGVKRGHPDIMIYERSNNYIGLAIELKYGKNKATPDQIFWLDELKARNWLTIISYDFDEVKKIVDEYLYYRNFKQTHEATWHKIK